MMIEEMNMDTAETHPPEASQPDMDLTDAEAPLSVSQQGVDAITAAQANVQESAVRQLRAQNASIQDSAVAFLQANHAQIDKGVVIGLYTQQQVINAGSIGIASAQAAAVQDSSIGVMVAREIHGGQLRTGLLLTGQVEGQIETVLDTRGALLLGLGMGTAIGLILSFFRFFNHHTH